MACIAMGRAWTGCVVAAERLLAQAVCSAFGSVACVHRANVALSTPQDASSSCLLVSWLQAAMKCGENVTCSIS